MRFVKWLNQNQGFVMMILTFVYVAATIFIVGLSIKTSRLAQKNLDVVVQFEKSRLRPYVLFNISSSIVNRYTYASIKNRGLSAAYNIRISIQPPLAHHYDGQSPLTHRDILFLPPDEEITDAIDSSPAFHEKYPEPVFAGTVEYADLEGNKYKEAFRIDLTFLKKRIYVREPSVGNELKHLNETLTAISKSLAQKDVTEGMT